MKVFLNQITKKKILNICGTVKPRFTAVFGGKEISAVNRGPR